MSALTQNFQEKFDGIRPRMLVLLKKHSGEWLKRAEGKWHVFVWPLAIGYLSANIVGGVIGSMMVSGMIADFARINIRKDEPMDASFERPSMANTRNLQKVIKERNLFNSEGKFPEEKAGAGAGGSLAKFDINAPCAPTTLPIDLMGTIYLGDPAKSLATVREKNYDEADIYRVGDSIYGNDQALVAAVERQKIIINNNGVKECIDLDKSKDQKLGDGFPDTGFGFDPGAHSSNSSELVLEAGYVESELGPGFGKIVDSARLVPNPSDGGINGFKIFAIKGGTLFARVGLQNGDIITQVNDTSLKNAEQGFSLYQAFQDEKQVRIRLLREGNRPVEISVNIK